MNGIFTNANMLATCVAYKTCFLIRAKSCLAYLALAYIQGNDPKVMCSDNNTAPSETIVLGLYQINTGTIT